MQVLQAFQVAARWHGFIALHEAEDGSAVWFRNALADAESCVCKRLCIDAITTRATHLLGDSEDFPAYESGSRGILLADKS